MFAAPSSFFHLYKNKATPRLTVLPLYPIILKHWDLMSNKHLQFRAGGTRPQTEGRAEPDMRGNSFPMTISVSWVLLLLDQGGQLENTLIASKRLPLARHTILLKRGLLVDATHGCSTENLHYAVLGGPGAQQDTSSSSERGLGSGCVSQGCSKSSHRTCFGPSSPPNLSHR